VPSACKACKARVLLAPGVVRAGDEALDSRGDGALLQWVAAKDLHGFSSSTEAKLPVALAELSGGDYR